MAHHSIFKAEKQTTHKSRVAIYMNLNVIMHYFCNRKSTYWENKD